jgi:DNA-binding MarR family transcriptional regulator
MPKPKRTPDAPISDELLLAAIERAERHRARENEPGVDLSTVKQHLGLPHHGGTTLRLRPQLEALESAGLIERFRHKSYDLMTLTVEGRTRLDAVGDEIDPLPEAPQHKRWREAQVAASERIAGFRGDVRGALDEAIALLETDHEGDSATWFELSERLHQAGRRLASAIYCLREWPEPDDSSADHDDDPPYGQRGRRNIRGWDSQFRF